MGWTLHRFSVIITSVLLSLACTALSAWADPSIEKISVDAAPSPNPALFGGTVSATFTVHLKDEEGNEIPPPPGTTFQWSCVKVTTAETITPVAATTGVTLDNPTTRTVTAHMSYTKPDVYQALPIDYTATLHVVVNNPIWAKPLEQDQLVDGAFGNVSVTFSPNPVRTGFCVAGAPGYIDIEVPVTAKVTPAAEAKNITSPPDIQGTNRVKISGWTVDDAAGTIAFNVTGISDTPNTSPNGDTTIVLKDQGVVAGSVAVVVIIPKHAIDSVQDQDVLPVNYAANQTTSPADLGTAPPNKHLVTGYFLQAAIPVYDQFGNLLDDCYNGAGVLENTNPINQGMNHGYYLDLIGGLGGEDGKVEGVTVEQTSADVTTWLKSRNHYPMLVGPSYPSFGVTVGGWGVGWFDRAVVTSETVVGPVTTYHVHCAPF